MEEETIRRPTVLLLTADTGGGHRACAEALGRALEARRPGGCLPVLCRPLDGPSAPRALAAVAGWYGPVVRRAPWLWGAAFHLTDCALGVRLLRRVLRPPVERAVAAAIARHRPAAVVSLHPLTGWAAVAARDRLAPEAAVVTVVTDPAGAHRAWRDARVDRVALPRGLGVPVRPEFARGPAAPEERAALRARLGVPDSRFTVLLVGGGRTARRAAALRGRFDEEVAVLSAGGGLSAGEMADRMRAADVVAGKAGPGVIAEAACVGTPMLVTSRLPGQERRNPALVVSAGMGVRVRGRRGLVAAVERLRAAPGRLAEMRSAALAAAVPGAAAAAASAICDALPRPTTDPRPAPASAAAFDWAPAPRPAPASASAFDPAPAPRPAPASAVASDPAPAPTPAPASAVASDPAPAPTPAPASAVAFDPAPGSAPAPAPGFTSAPASASVPAPAPGSTSAPASASVPAPAPGSTPAPAPGAVPAPTPGAAPAPVSSPMPKKKTTTLIEAGSRG
ncbi:glycosyltransferase [Phaeacidiphilus oryzae]|uniref:glycosyltransferase n=1 Tax=Phaeacidiphilus oryzae TaxID=348818 RepID=UPI00069217E1|nr:glycosyltransferase [Phaeacidiphilus oryzae]